MSNQVYAINLVLAGMLIGALIVVACTAGGDTMDAHAEDASSHGEDGMSQASGELVTVELPTPADQDPTRLQKGVVVLSFDGKAVVEGPMIVTEILGDANNRIWVATDGCSSAGTAAEIGNDNAPTGMRIYIAPGEQLCVNVTQNAFVGKGVFWAGFVPHSS